MLRKKSGSGNSGIERYLVSTSALVGHVWFHDRARRFFYELTTKAGNTIRLWERQVHFGTRSGPLWTLRVAGCHHLGKKTARASIALVGSSGLAAFLLRDP
jgi:hypothetical protein